MKEVAEGVFVESSYAPYNLTLIRTSLGAIVVDVPPDPFQAERWLREAEEVGGGVRYVVLTDGGLARQFGTTGIGYSVPIIAAEETLRIIQTYYGDERIAREFVEACSAHYPYAQTEGEPVLPPRPALAFNRSFAFHDDGREISFEVINGVRRGSLWVLVRDVGVLIAGETVVADGVPDMSETPDSAAWLSTMTALAHRAAVRGIVPGRGPFLRSRAALEPQREFMRVMRRTARALARPRGDGLGLAQAARELGQAFFNAGGAGAVDQIKAGLAHLVEEVQRRRAQPQEDTPSVEEGA
ncbi:MAG TPA: hypothetical protein ENL34_03420 [Chloroflexi bacterium]|nr:hypothetical protein [Chloroflexota bacterium]